jgi:predicted NodU family carbamoyl transferase
MIVLGINETHCATAALIADGRVVGCASEERFTRLKNDAGYPRLAIDALLAELHIARADIDRVALAGAGAGSREWLNRVLHDEAYAREYYGVSLPSPRRLVEKRLRKLGSRLGLVETSRGKFRISQRRAVRRRGGTPGRARRPHRVPRSPFLPRRGRLLRLRLRRPRGAGPHQ